MTRHVAQTCPRYQHRMRSLVINACLDRDSLASSSQELGNGKSLGFGEHPKASFFKEEVQPSLHKHPPSDWQMVRTSLACATTCSSSNQAGHLF